MTTLLARAFEAARATVSEWFVIRGLRGAMVRTVMLSSVAEPRWSVTFFALVLAALRIARADLGRGSLRWTVRSVDYCFNG